MLVFLAANWINIALILVVTAVVALMIRSLVRDKKAGKSACGGSCASCGACGGCAGCASCAAKPKL